MNKRMLFGAMAGALVLWVGSANAEDAAGRVAGEYFTGKEQVVALPGGTQMAFVWIEPGTFQMGTRLPEDEWLKGLEKSRLKGGMCRCMRWRLVRGSGWASMKLLRSSGNDHGNDALARRRQR